MARICLITPFPPRTIGGNTTTSRRWAAQLRALGHRVHLGQAYAGQPADVLLALHARRSSNSVLAFRRRHPERPVVVALTGTDLYRDLPGSRRAQRVLEMATRLVVLQPLARQALAAPYRRKVRVILQSVRQTKRVVQPRPDTFDVVVLSQLREVKDPLRAAFASRLLPGTSRLRVLHAGRALTTSFEKRARRETQQNPRYVWLGELPKARAARLLAASRALVLSSRLEGGANVASEAIVAGVPVLASRMPGNVGLLGATYPGYFEVGDTRGLALLLQRLETDARFRARLQRWVRRLAPRFTPLRERAAWARLLRELRLH